ncbi:hypothetical protein LCGC14_0976650 [marine sediment metagenome]|uniref:DZANK-type domain-containing protein n=1 Tax=marine sediment metagenome TaxID=412755 RepID=A0A0F9NA15_9ZZZZ
MGIKIIKTAETIKVCPNDKEHIEDLVLKMKAKPDATLLPQPFAPRLRKRGFCAQCGTKVIDKTIKHENTACDRCGETVYPSDSYCPACGDELR